MDRVAVFVDAGYLFAQGSVAISGSKKRRVDLVLNAPAVVAELEAFAIAKAAGCSLLRFYWYDGAIGGTRPTADQALLAHLDNVKLRLGFVNSVGEQKGVDSLIVTDLIELARQKSICDAVLTSGDEDVRVGVQIAQNYGIKIHLLGIVPIRGSQSPTLMQEADTASEWQAETIEKFLSVRPTLEAAVAALAPTAAASSGMVVATPSSETMEIETEIEQAIEAAVKEFVGDLKQSDLDGISAYWKTERGVPSEFDRHLLPRGRDAIGRNLERMEIRFARTRFQFFVRERLGLGGG